MTLSLPARRSIWETAPIVLGLNLWLTLLLLPALHLERPGGPSRTLLPLLLGLAPAALGLGALLRQALVLLGLFPLLLVVPVLLDPRLIGVNVLTPWTFVLIAIGFLAYMALTPLILSARASTPQEGENRRLDLRPLTPHWRRRFRVYRGLAVLAAVFPMVLIGTLFLHPRVQTDLARFYPGRAAEALTLFGVLALALWLGIFYADFLSPLRAHVRGDPRLRQEIDHLRRRARQRRPTILFHLFVIAALALMLALFLLRR